MQPRIKWDYEPRRDQEGGCTLHAPTCRTGPESAGCRGCRGRPRGRISSEAPRAPDGGHGDRGGLGQGPETVFVAWRGGRAGGGGRGGAGAGSWARRSSARAPAGGCRWARWWGRGRGGRGGRPACGRSSWSSDTCCRRCTLPDYLLLAEAGVTLPFILCSLFVAELFTVLLTYISKSQPFQDGRTMCRSVPVSMRGWCRSPPVGGTAGWWRRCRGGWGWATRRCRSWRGPGVCSGASCRATASYCSHRSATTQLVLAWRSQPRPRHWL